MDKSRVQGTAMLETEAWGCHSMGDIGDIKVELLRVEYGQRQWPGRVSSAGASSGVRASWLFDLEEGGPC